MIIPVANPARQNALLAPELMDATQEVMRSGQYILGHYVRKFEQEFASYHGARHCLGVNSGSDALYLALRAAEVGIGDEVIVPASTFVATAEAVARTGAFPVFCDITEDGRDLIDVSKIKGLITPKTKAVIPVHLHGYVCDMKSIMDIAADHSLVVIEDCAQATGASVIIGDKRYAAGSMGHIGCFSFFPTKNLGCLGDGGAIITNEDGIAQEIEALRQHGGAKNNPHFIGVNSRLDGIQAAYLSVKLPFLDEWNAMRRALSERYNNAFEKYANADPVFNYLLGEGIAHGAPITSKLPMRFNGKIKLPNLDHDAVFHHYSMRVPIEMRDDLIAYLASHDIGAMAYYPWALNKVRAYEIFGESHVPVAEAQALTNLSLPLFPEMNSYEQERVVYWFVEGVKELWQAKEVN